jgi:hypothetical protein
VGIADYTWENKSAAAVSDAFSEVISAYLFEGLPHAILTEDDFHGMDQMSFTLEAGDSWCGGDGLPDQPIRWSVDGAEFLPDWTAAQQGIFQFQEPGKHVVILEVRNTVGWTSKATATFEIFASQPANLGQLLDTFAYAHITRDVGLLYQCLAPELKFNLLPQDILDHALPSDHFDLGSFLSVTSSLFSESFEVGRPPILLNIGFWFGEPNVGSEMTVLTHISAMRFDAETLYVGGQISFVAGSTPIVLSDGKSADVWRFIEITDNTEPGGFGSGNISWGGLLATYK